MVPNPKVRPEPLQQESAVIIDLAEARAQRLDRRLDKAAEEPGLVLMLFEVGWATWAQLMAALIAPFSR